MKLFVTAALFTAALTFPAFAYLDPGTGTMIVQAIIGGLAVAGATLSIYWQRIKSLFAPRSSKNK